MYQNKTFSQLKTLAKRQMQGNMGTLICAFIVQELLVFLATSFVITLIPGTDPVSSAIYYIVTFIVQLLAGLLQAGSCLMFLHCACNMPFHIGDLFYCIKNSPDRAIKVQCILALLQCICMLPSDFVLWNMVSPLSYTNVLIASLVSLACSILFMIVSLGFFPVFYIMLDFPTLTTKEIYERSWHIMNGHKWRYFLLQLSFIPLMLLCFFTCGIALLWVIPYMNITCTNFYLDLMANINRTQSV